MRFALSESSSLLWLLLLLPIVPFVSFFVFGKRVWLSTLLRMFVFGALILALADLQWVRETSDTDVILLVDQSDSLGVDGKYRAWQIARRLSLAERSGTPGSKRVGVVVFGKNALVENPLREEPRVAESPEVAVDASQSNIAKALRFAGTQFDRVANRRIVLLTDGEATDEELVSVSHQLAAQGIEIDVLKVFVKVESDVVVESIDIPSAGAVNTPMSMSVRVRNGGVRASKGGEASETGRSASAVSGRLVVQRVQGDQVTTIADGPLRLEKELEVVPLRDTPMEGGLVVYEAKFIADELSSDTYTQNNTTTAVTQIIDKGKVLVITTDDQIASVTDRLEFLGDHGITCDVRKDGSAFANISDLLQYESVVFVNTPRIEMSDGLPILKFTDEQIGDLKTYVHDFGGGCMMIGGPKSMGAGNWMNTALEEAMPVKFQVDNEKVVSVGALALVIDKSGSMDGDKIALSKAAAAQAMSMLSDSDYIGIYPFDSQLVESVPMKRLSGERERIKRSIRRIGAAGGTDMTSALDAAYRDLQKNPASLKHVIVLTDGDTAGSNFERLAADMNRRGITTSAVAVGAGANARLLMDIAKQGNGRFYKVDNPNAIPRIFMKETRMLSKPLVRDFSEPVRTMKEASHEVLQGMGDSLPGIDGIVLTTLRESVLAEQLVRSELPESPNDTLLATWQYGAGRTGVWTADLGERWAKRWNETGALDQLLVQTLRWLRRYQSEHGHVVRVDSNPQRTRVSLEWDDANKEIPVGMECLVTGIGSSYSTRGRLERTGPRTFEVLFDALPSGSYALAVDTGGGKGVMTQGFSVRDVQEFQRKPNSLQALIQLAEVGAKRARKDSVNNSAGVLEKIAELESEGRWIDESKMSMRDQESTNDAGNFGLFRPTSTRERALSSTWPIFLLIASGLLLAEIAGRKLGWDRWMGTNGIRRNELPKMASDFPVVRSGTRARTVSMPTQDPEVVDGMSYTERLLKTKSENQKRR